MNELLLLSGAIAVGFLGAVAYYESLCLRDVLVARAMRHARRVSQRRWVAGAAYAASVGIGIPVLIVLWTVVLYIALLFVGSVDRLGNVAIVATAIVAATRILAYIREKTAHELAKAIPLALAFVLLTGGTLKFEENLARLTDRPEGQELTEEMILFLVILEVGLRLVTDTSRVALAAIRERRGIDSDLGVWRTLWAALRPPRGPAPADEAGVVSTETRP
jgi:hypothetical protein